MARGVATQKKKKDHGFPYRFPNVMDGREVRGPSDRPRLLVKYETEVRKALSDRFGYRNPYQVPRLSKIVLNIGLGEAARMPKLLEQGFDALGRISGQRPVVTRARKSIAGFKLREGMKIGCMVTLRRLRMWDFLDNLISVALPRTRDFRGVSPRAFDGRGNYTLGIREILIFPEVDIERLDKVPGMNVCIHTTAETDEEGLALLDALGMPFRKAKA